MKKNITGIKVKQREHIISQFADDTTVQKSRSEIHYSDLKFFHIFQA